jgi:hypothetical protein
MAHELYISIIFFERALLNVPLHLCLDQAIQKITKHQTGVGTGSKVKSPTEVKPWLDR